MKKIITLAVAVAILAALAGCGNSPMSSETSDNGAKAELIAVVDGCNVWRLNDWHTVYLFRCPVAGEAQSTNHLEGAKAKVDVNVIGNS